MPDEGLLKISGAQEPAPDKFTSLAFIKLIGGLQTQRSAFASIDNRYNSRFLGGKPDALIAGSNVEISNKLTLQRRPGLIAYGTANVPAPTAFFDWQLATTSDIILVLDTETPGGDNNAGPFGAVFNYSPTSSGIYVNKANQSKQTNFLNIVNTLYMGDGVDLLKVVGPNLLYQSNTFGMGSGTSFSIQSPWIDANVFALTDSQTDPLGGTTATQLVWTTSGAASFLEQDVLPNYTPIASNTFTFSFWMKNNGTPLSVNLKISDQSGSISDTLFNLTPNWVKYQVTGTMNPGSNVIKIALYNPSSADTMFIYGAQLEVGGPATTIQITTIKPQGVYLWGIQAPNNAPSAVTSGVVGNAWAPNHVYATAILALTSVTTGTGVYTGTITGGAGDAFVGRYFTILGFNNAPNNGLFVCTASDATTLTLTNPNSIAETATATATPTLNLTSVDSTGTYFGTIDGGGGNNLAGYAGQVRGFANPSNNGSFFFTTSTGVSLTALNPSAIAETNPAIVLIFGQAVTDSNGNLEAAISSGMSGSTQPFWNQSIGGTTADGVLNVFLVQEQTSVTTGASPVTAAFGSPVTNLNSIFVFTIGNSGNSPSVSDDNSNSYTLIAKETVGAVAIWMYWCQSANAGATTVTVASTTNTYLAIAEFSTLTGLTSNNTNGSSGIPIGATSFQTGVVTTVSTSSIVISFAMFRGNGEVSAVQPSGYSTIFYEPAFLSGGDFDTISAAFEFYNIPTVVNPSWEATAEQSGNRYFGITANLTSTNTNTLVWENLGPIGLTTDIGYQYYYAFMNSVTGHVSNVSPISTSTGPIAGQSVTITGRGMQITPSGPYSQDPQVDMIAIYRNAGGGGFWYQLVTIPNPGTTTSPGTWTYSDIIPDTRLNTSIFAPIGLLNSLPPAGMVDMEYFAGRMWGSVNNFLYYNTGPDNATLINIQQNGVPAESWAPANVIPFNAPITRIVAVGGGLIVCTTTDTWFVTGVNLLTGGFNPGKALAKHGVRSYNAVDLDGSSIYLYTSDRQCLIINPNSGSVEIGYPIGDTLEDTFNPLNVYIARHVSGSRDNAVFMADGSTGWYRLNPNQQGASMQGEATPLWSPKANFVESIGGIGALASIETSAGVIKLLVGQTVVGPVLARSLTTFTDNGIPYQWSATVGSILLATAGKLAETESITTEFDAFNGTASQCTVSVLLDEIGGTFESLPQSVNDPPQLAPTISVLGARFYLSQGTVPPVCRHIQIKLEGEIVSGLPTSSKDELLALTVRGALVSEQQ